MHLCFIWKFFRERPWMALIFWSFHDSFICSASSNYSFSLFRLGYFGRFAVASPLRPDILTLLLNIVAKDSFSPCLQMPESFCTFGSTQRSNGHNSMLWTTREGTSHQRSTQSTPCAKMKRLTDRCLIVVLKMLFLPLILPIPQTDRTDRLLWFILSI